jgi:hypothetical protein
MSPLEDLHIQAPSLPGECSALIMLEKFSVIFQRNSLYRKNIVKMNVKSFMKITGKMGNNSKIKDGIIIVGLKINIRINVHNH